MKCPKCDREFKNYNGLTTHLARTHSINREESYVLIKLGGLAPVCDYDSCSNKPKFRGNSRGYQKYCPAHRGKWQEGLTKDNDERIKLRGASISKAQLDGKHWAHNPEIRKETCLKISEARALTKKPKTPGPYDDLSKGPSWSKGLTKYTDPRLKKISIAVKEGIKKNGGVWSKGLTKYTDSRLIKLSTSLLLPQDEIEKRVKKREKDFKLVTSTLDYKSYQSHLEVECIKCKTLQRKTLKALDEGSQCYICFPPRKTSKAQEEVLTFVKSLGVKAFSTREIIQPKEIDVFIPEFKFGIEFNGLYWHSEKAGAICISHQQKTEMCSEQGIRLLHIFEDEWRDKRSIVESMISHNLGMSRRYFARKCLLQDCSRQQASQFMNENHLDGNVKFKHAISLSMNGEILGALTLRRKVFSVDTHEIEIARLAFKKGTFVIGGMSKLISAAIKWAKKEKYTRIISYADDRFGYTHAYDKAGLIFDKKTVARFWWTDFNHRYNRTKYKARDGVPEKEVARAAGVSKIWGCKNSKYVLEL